MGGHCLEEEGMAFVHLSCTAEERLAYKEVKEQ